MVLKEKKLLGRVPVKLLPARFLIIILRISSIQPTLKVKEADNISSLMRFVMLEAMVPEREGLLSIESLVMSAMSVMHQGIVPVKFKLLSVLEKIITMGIEASQEATKSISHNWVSPAAHSSTGIEFGNGMKLKSLTTRCDALASLFPEGHDAQDVQFHQEVKVAHGGRDGTRHVLKVEHATRERRTIRYKAER